MEKFPTYEQFYFKNNLQEASAEKLARAKAAYKKAYQKHYAKHFKNKNVKRIDLRLPLELDKEITTEAKKKKISKSRYITAMLVQGMSFTFQLPEETILYALETQLRKIGVNINQLVAKCHRKGINADRLEALYTLVEKALVLVEDTLRHPPLKKEHKNTDSDKESTNIQQP